MASSPLGRQAVRSMRLCHSCLLLMATKAGEIRQNAKVLMAIVDDAGVLSPLKRLDGTRIASVQVAIDKKGRRTFPVFVAMLDG